MSQQTGLFELHESEENDWRSKVQVSEDYIVNQAVFE